MTTQIDPTTNQPVQPKSKSNRKWIFIIGGLLAACCLIGVVAALLAPPKSTPTSDVVNNQQLEATVVDATEVKEVSPKEPSKTPEPTETEAPATKSLYIVGEKAEVEGISITVLSIQKTNKLELFSADAGNTYLDIEVIIENISRDEATPYNSLYFKVKDDTAAEYTTTLDAISPSLKSGSLVKGDKARGHVAFEVPENSKGFIVSYEPMVLFGGYETIRINLEEKTETIPEVGTLEIGESQVGQRFESAGIAITIVSAQTTTSIGGMPPSSDMIYLDFEVLLENIDRDEETPYNPLYFQVKDANYWEYSTSFLSLDPSLTSGELVKGDKVRGHVAFEVPAQVKKFVVSYEPDVLFGGYQPISVNVVIP